MENVKSDLIRGNIDTIILRCLHRGEMYGLEICNLIRDASKGTFILKQPTLYSSLKRLEQRGMIASYWRDSAIGGRRHYYKLTDAGIASFKGKKENWNDAKDVIDALVDGENTKHRQIKEIEIQKKSVPGTVASLNVRGVTALTDIISPYNPFAESDDYLTLPIGISEIQAETGDENSGVGKQEPKKVNDHGDFEITPLQPYVLNSGGAVSSEQSFADNYIKPFSQSIQTDAAVTQEKKRGDTVFSRYLAPGDCAVVNANREIAMTLKASKIAQYDVEIIPFVKHYNNSPVCSGSNARNGYLFFTRLQCVSALIISCLMAAALLIIWACLKIEYSIDEKNLFAMAYVVIGAYLLTYLLLFFNNPGLKKLANGLRREHWIRLAVAVVLIISVVCINILIGLTSVTWTDYVVFIVVPSVLALTVYLEYVIQAFLRKSRVFAG